MQLVGQRLMQINRPGPSRERQLFSIAVVAGVCECTATTLPTTLPAKLAI
jgi:hypothetical protein